MMRIRLTPNAQKVHINGIVADEQGSGILRIAIDAIPEQDRANKALIKYVSKLWEIPKSKIALVWGQKDRTKTLHIDAAGPNELQKLEIWVASFAP